MKYSECTCYFKSINNTDYTFGKEESGKLFVLDIEMIKTIPNVKIGYRLYSASVKTSNLLQWKQGTERLVAALLKFFKSTQIKWITFYQFIMPK